MTALQSIQEYAEQFDADLEFSYGYEGDAEFPETFAIAEPSDCDHARDSRTRHWFAPMTPQDQQATDDYLRRLREWQHLERCIEIFNRYGYWVCKSRPTLKLPPRPQPPVIHSTARDKTFQELGGANGVDQLADQFVEELRAKLKCDQRGCPGGGLCEFHSKTIKGRGTDFTGKQTYYDLQVYARCACGEGVSA